MEKIGSKPFGTYGVSFKNIINDYTGSSDITNSRITPWLSYLNSRGGQSNTSSNMKATAYLLDTNVWDANFKGSKADYAIGGPTLDMFVASYKKTHPSEYIEFRPSATGYAVKWNTDTTYQTGLVELDGIFDSTNKLHIVSNYYWIASPSISDTDAIMYLSDDGFLYGDGYVSVRRLILYPSNSLFIF